MGVFVEDWAAGYGSPYLVADDGDVVPGNARPLEDGGEMIAHRPGPVGLGAVAFVDGVRRAEAVLYDMDDATGAVARGLAGAHACGAVVAVPGERPAYERCQTRRLVVWGSGRAIALPDVAGNWVWDVAAVTSDHPDEPLSAPRATSP